MCAQTILVLFVLRYGPKLYLQDDGSYADDDDDDDDDDDGTEGGAKKEQVRLRIKLIVPPDRTKVVVMEGEVTRGMMMMMGGSSEDDENDTSSLFASSTFGIPEVENVRKASLQKNKDEDLLHCGGEVWVEDYFESETQQMVASGGGGVKRRKKLGMFSLMKLKMPNRDTLKYTVPIPRGFGGGDYDPDDDDDDDDGEEDEFDTEEELSDYPTGSDYADEQNSKEKGSDDYKNYGDLGSDSEHVVLLKAWKKAMEARELQKDTKVSTPRMDEGTTALNEPNLTSVGPVTATYGGENQGLLQKQDQEEQQTDDYFYGSLTPPRNDKLLNLEPGAMLSDIKAQSTSVETNLSTEALISTPLQTPDTSPKPENLQSARSESASKMRAVRSPHRRKPARKIPTRPSFHN
uniref:Uncharacterized protein n=2 Tax=Ditylum brightwellii TaxID=49249 RepID=A0A6V2EWG9_9STRA